MTTCYGVLYYGKVTHTAWSKSDLLKLDGVSPDEIIEIEVPPIIDSIKAYFDKRGLLYAQQPVEALLFLNSEIGELNDAIVHKMGDWVRNNERERDADMEIGDVVMMTAITAKLLGYDDVIELMFEKWRRKGFDIHE
jgi:NTP pyrophosphatase (non-canonical NTP hydrolase)